MRRAAETLVQRSGQRYVSPVRIAALYTHAEAAEEALAWLEQALEVRDTQITYARVVPHFQDLRDHPRFREIVRRINLPP